LALAPRQRPFVPPRAILQLVPGSGFPDFDGAITTAGDDPLSIGRSTVKCNEPKIVTDSSQMQSGCGFQ